MEISFPTQAARRVERHELNRSWGEGLTKSAEDPRLRAPRFWTIRGRRTVGFGGGCDMLNCRFGLNKIF